MLITLISEATSYFPGKSSIILKNSSIILVIEEILDREIDKYRL